MPTPTHGEEQGSPRERWAEGSGYEVERVFRCAWEDRWAVAAVYLGNHYLLSEMCIARSATCAGVTARQKGSGSVASYQSALVTVTYNTLSSRDKPRETVNGQIISERIESATEFMTRDYELFAWDASGDTPIKPDEAPGELKKMTNYLLTLYDLENVPNEAFDYCGHVNNAAVHTKTPGLNKTFAAETLLLQPAQMSRTISVDDGVLTGLKWQLDLSFVHKPDGWNKFWRAASQAWAQMYVSGSAYKPYPLAPFGVF